MDPANIPVLDSLREVLNYAEIGEERDYDDQDEHGRANHILVHIHRVRAWLDTPTTTIQ